MTEINFECPVCEKPGLEKIVHNMIYIIGLMTIDQSYMDSPPLNNFYIVTMENCRSYLNSKKNQ